MGLVFAALIPQASLADIVVYDNTVNLWTGASQSGTALFLGDGVEWGDEVTLAGSSRIGTQLEVLTYCSGTKTAGTVLSLYDNTGAGGAPNNLLWTTDLGLVHYSYLTPLIASLPNVLLPDTVTWTFRLYGSGGYSVGTILYDPPSVGSSGDWYWCNYYGFSSATCDWVSPRPPANFGAKITAVPEPCSFVMLSVSVLVTAAWYWSWRRTGDASPSPLTPG